MTAAEVMTLLDEVVEAVRGALAAVEDWGLAGTRAGQHHSDLAADAAALAVLRRAGVGVLSEESGLRGAARPLLVVVDPLDGSTNAAQGIPWFATSLCAVDADGPLAALVVNLVTGDRFEARRGGGATRNGLLIGPSSCTSVRQAIVGLSGFPPRWLGWRQYPGARGGGARPVPRWPAACSTATWTAAATRTACGTTWAGCSSARRPAPS